METHRLHNASDWGQTHQISVGGHFRITVLLLGIQSVECLLLAGHEHFFRTAHDEIAALIIVAFAGFG